MRAFCGDDECKIRCTPKSCVLCVSYVWNVAIGGEDFHKIMCTESARMHLKWLNHGLDTAQKNCESN